MLLSHFPLCDRSRKRPIESVRQAVTGERTSAVDHGIFRVRDSGFAEASVVFDLKDHLSVVRLPFSIMHAREPWSGVAPAAPRPSTVLVFHRAPVPVAHVHLK